MSGIANKRPPQPRYNQIWDIQQVLDYLKALPDNDKLTLRQLTLKTVGLLALTQINRGSELKYLNLGFMRESNQTYVFSFNQHTKTSRRKRKRVPDMTFSCFAGEQSLPPEKRKLCPFTCISYYLQATEPLRGKPRKKQLFIGQIKPHKEVEKATIAGWLKMLLKCAGIDTTIFKAHSYRAASSSKAKALGVPIEDILKTGNWTNSSTWQKFYHKPIKQGITRYQEKILSGSKL